VPNLGPAGSLQFNLVRTATLVSKAGLLERLSGLPDEEQTAALRIALLLFRVEKSGLLCTIL
jgi:hypothetical protein